MPSFSTISGSYNHFFVTIIDNAPLLSDKKNHTFCKFLLISLVIIIFTIISITTYFIFIYFDYHEFDGNNLWISYKLFWIYDVFVYIGISFITFIITSLLITATINTPIFHYLTICHKKFIIILIIFMLFVTSIYLSVAYIFEYIFTEGSTKSVFNSQDFICSIIKCDFWSLMHLYLHIIFVGFLPIIFFVLWLILNILIFCGSKNKNNTKHLYRHYSIEKIENNDLELGLLHRPSAIDRHKNKLNNKRGIIDDSYDISINSSQHTAHSNLFEQMSNRDGIKYALLFGILFGILWIFKFFCGRINTNVLKNGDDFEYLYYYVLCYTSFWKFVLKKVSRKIDKMRIRNNELNYILSVEFFMEWYVSIVYFAWFRINIVYNVPPLSLFIVIFLVHLSSEILQSFTRFSVLYFNLSFKILLYLKEKSECNIFYRFIYKIFEDDSNIDEWRNRNAMDMILRLYSSLLISIIQGYLMLIIGSSGFHNEYEINSYYTGIYYAIFVIVGELIYYIMLWIYNWYCNQYDIFSPFILFVMGMTKGHQILILFTFFSAIVPSMLQ